MYHRLETFTPAKAIDWLNAYVLPMHQDDWKQRPVYKDTVELYARQMVAREFQTMPGAIAVRVGDHRLMNGRHTLHAVIEAGVAVELDVAYDCPPQAWGNFDRPRVRSISDATSIDPWHTQVCRVLAERLNRVTKASAGEVKAVFGVLESSLNQLHKIQAKSVFQRHGSVTLRTAAAVRLLVASPRDATVIKELWRQHMSQSQQCPFMEAAHRRLATLPTAGGSRGQSTTLALGWKIFDPRNLEYEPKAIHLPQQPNDLIREMLQAYRDHAPIKSAQVVGLLRKSPVSA